MVEVVSLGSINVDRTRYLTTDEIESLAARRDWFPAPGETRSIPETPADLPEGPFENFLGGKAANQAVAAARAGAETALLGKVGEDAAEYDVRDTLRRRGVDVSPVEPASRSTGKAFIFVDESGESHIAIVAGANGTVDAAYVSRYTDVIREADALVFQNEIPTTGIRSALDGLVDDADAPTVIYDPAPVEAAEAVVDHPAIDILSPNETEYAALEPHIPADGPTVIQRRGPADVIVESSGAERFRITPPAVDAVDTTGAGDVFNGYLAAGLASGLPLEPAVEWATAAASYSTELVGAQQAIPERESLPSDVRPED